MYPWNQLLRPCKCDFAFTGAPGSTLEQWNPVCGDRLPRGSTRHWAQRCNLNITRSVMADARSRKHATAGTVRSTGNRPARAKNGGRMMRWREVWIDGWIACEWVCVERLSVFLMHGWLPPGPTGLALKMHTILFSPRFFFGVSNERETWPHLTSFKMLQTPLTISDLVVATLLWIPNRPLPASLVNQFYFFKLIKPIIW